MKELRDLRGLADTKRFLEAKNQFQELLHHQEIRWQQRAKTFWLNPAFFQNHWDIVGPVISAACIQFLHQRSFPADGRLEQDFTGLDSEEINS